MRKSEQGFTLIEIIVSLAVFSIVMLVATGTLLSMVDANKKAQSLKSVMNNLNFALENMSRTIRTGTNYECGSVGGDCALGDTSFSFVSSDNEAITYRLSGTQLERDVDGQGFIPITAPEVQIEDFTFYVTGTGGLPDVLQPRVVMTIKGKAGATTKVQSEFNLQATVSQRLVDL